MADTAKWPNNAAGKTRAGIESREWTQQLLNVSIGARVRVQTAPPSPKTLEGNVFTICPQMALLAISTGPPSSPTHHILPFSALSSLAVLSLPSTSATSRNIGPLDTTALLDRANTAVATAKEKAAKVNKGVGREIQEIFDALDKQFSARWKEKDIIVMERVVLRGPGYRVEDCKVITKDGEGLLGRVKKVLENERKRALQREGSKPVKPAVPTIVPAVPAPRKGG
ncbi:MAG: hypothetical protein OHK93_001063 [Ramalina farinacea]|uniref:AD domain-containing protein n=1 Tax=Ramalina farinacea TaxID=258253 RepID=A0AA43QQI2_9LECA|nr:hypothetical protein [Ramalina farinacea]